MAKNILIYSGGTARFEAGPVVLYDHLGEYRPANLRNHVAFTAADAWARCGAWMRCGRFNQSRRANLESNLIQMDKGLPALQNAGKIRFA